MLEIWNDSSLQPPPVLTSKCEVPVDIQQLSYVCNNAIKTLSRQSPFHQEAAVCSRFIYKFSKKFRNDIGFRNVKKVNTALRKYLKLNLIKDIENFLVVLPTSDDEMYFPSKQMLQYVLVRIMTFSKIMLRICVCSKQGAIFYLDRVKRGESHWMSLMPYALLSRIWSMSMVLLQHSCNWYSNFHQFHGILIPKGLDFLPPDFILPSDIARWLDMKNLDSFGKFEWSQKKHIDIDLSLTEEIDGDVFENILEYVNQVNEELEEADDKDIENADRSKNENNEQLPVSNIMIDHGERISRDSLTNFFKPKDGLKVNHYPESVTNKESLHKFITTEEKFRNENHVKSLTSHLSFMQWQALKKTLISLHESLSKNRKIEKKFQKIWKEKCLDYK